MRKSFRNSNLQSGQAMLLAVLFFLAITTTIVMGTATPILKQVKISNDTLESKSSYYLAEGALEDALYRIKNGKNIFSGDTVMINGYTSTITITTTSSGKTIESLAIIDGKVRKMQAKVVEGQGVAFNYGVQAGNGGFSLAGGSQLNGNVYSNGPIVATNGVTITGSAISASSTATIGGDNGPWGVYIGTAGVGDAWGYNVKGATVAGNLYCQTGTGNNKACNTSKGIAPNQEFPFDDEMIQGWKDQASEGWIYNGNLTIGSVGTTTGPMVVNGDLLVNGGGRLTMTGTIWVTGTVTFTGGADLHLASSYGNSSEVLVADGYISLTGGSNFAGSGQVGSYPMLFTTSICPAGTGCGTRNAIDLGGGSGAVVLVAQNGTLKMSGGVGARSVTAKQIIVTSGATITYDAGLANLNFSSGPSGGWNVSSWKEVQ
ncbi:MAG: hypothetical protein M3Q63_00690 [bacterium]|nr:hypothetical protein [bacterium]